MRKLTFLCTLFLLFLSGKMSADNLRFDPDTQQENPLPGSLNNSQYTWTSPTITAPEGFTTLRISFIQTYNNAVSSSDYPYVCISEFYLYDKNKNQVTLSADNFSTNAQQSGEGSMTEICDGITATSQESPNYWHSTWSAKVGAHHYLEVTMPEGEYDLSEFSIGWITRAQIGAPKEIVVTTGNSHEDVTAQTTPRNIIYEYTYTPAGGTEQIWLSEPIADCIPTSKLPTPTKRAYGITNTTLVNNGYVPEDNESHAYKVTCTLSDSYPFQFADSYANIEHWYSLRLTKEKKYLRYDANDTYIPVSETLIPEDADIQAYTWGFVGNPYTGFQIYNLASGEQKILSSSTTMNGETDGTTYPLLTDISVPEGYNTHWDVTESSHLPKGFFLGQHGFGNNRINNRGGKVAYWVGGADAGSTVLATEIAKNSYEILFQQAVDALTAPLDVLKYTPALCTAEDFAAAKQQVTNIINNYAPATTDKSAVLTAITALSETEASAAIDAALNHALEELVNNTYVTLCNAQHPTDYLTINGESSGVTTVADKTVLWQLKVQDKQVILYHVESKRYMGDLPNENSVSVPTSDQTAGLYYLIPTPDQTENVVSFVQDLSAGTTAWGLHDNGYSKIVRWYANTQGTQWTIDAKDVSAPQLAALADSRYMIYHTDEAGVEHYLQIAPDGTLSLTTTPTYSFRITKGTTFPSNETPKAEYAYYLAMNGYRLSHWSTEKGTFNTNAIADNPNVGVWHCQVLYRNIDENNSELYGKYAIRSTNAAETGYFANSYMTITNGQLSYAEPTDETDNTLYQWEIRGGYPFNLSPDASDPNAYAIKSGRTDETKEWWYTYTNDGKIHLNNFVGYDKEQYWYFTETKENGTYYLLLHPLAAPGKLISYSDHTAAANKVSGQDAGTEGYDSKWLFDAGNGEEPFGMKTSDNSIYLSNYGGYTNNMGFWTAGPSSDAGTAMYFTAFSNPNIEWWAGLSSLLGNDLGQYNISNWGDLTQNISKATRAAAYFNAKDALYAAMNTESMNKPTAGFYRFKGKVSGNYMDGTVYNAGTDGGQMNMVAEAGKTNIFYLNENKKLLNYSNGTYLQNTRATNAVGAENGSVINFFSSEGNNYGFYTMKANNSGSQYIYDNTNRVDRNGAYAANNCDWTIEKVDALPVSIGTAKWSTFCAPVALTIPENMTVYYANTEEKNGTVAVKPLTGIIPANLPVLLQAEPDEYTFYISTEAGTVPTDVNADLKGTPAGEITKEADGSSYVLTVLKSSSNVGFARNMTGAVPGFKAYLEPSNATGSEEYSISFSDIADGIQSVNAREQLNTEYYDLNGRRVFFPTRGIYVTNKGEKVFIK